MLNKLEYYRNKNVLLLQGPRGLCFWRLKKDLETVNAKVYKINFNGGDYIFYPFDCINYRGTKKKWFEFFKNILKEKKIDIVLLFSDFRYYHKIAKEICISEHIPIGCFEEGYIRPNYITLDYNGVNGYSRLINKKFYFKDFQIPDNFDYSITKTGNTIYHEILYAIIYYLFANLMYIFYPYYRHHISLYFPISLYKTAWPWVKTFISKYYYHLLEYEKKKIINEKLQNKYFFVPLQVYNDSQVVIHSNFKNVEEFIENVIKSFASFAANDTYLVFKHHPRSRGHINYNKYICQTANKYNVKDRVFYIHDMHLPTLLDNSIGVIVINSSVGFQTLEHYKPLIVLGKAIYSEVNITYQDSLDTFWNKAKNFKMDKNLFQKLKNFVIYHTQINGSLHKKVNEDTYTGFKYIQ